MGSLSAAVGIGKAGTGAMAAPGPLEGRPIAQNGTSSCFGGAGCCAPAGTVRHTSTAAARDHRRVITLSLLDGGALRALSILRAMTVAPRHLSMLRGFHLADFLTLGNAACGTLAVFAVIAFVERRDVGLLFAAAALIPVALVFDVLDGRIARSRHAHSPMGRELDSLADVISFGVAPAAVAYGAGMKDAWDVIILVYFVACGVSRLARFNVTADALAAGGDKVKYFEGTPIPSSLLLV